MPGYFGPDYPATFTGICKKLGITRTGALFLACAGGEYVAAHIVPNRVFFISEEGDLNPRGMIIMFKIKHLKRPFRTTLRQLILISSIIIIVNIFVFRGKIFNYAGTLCYRADKSSSAERLFRLARCLNPKDLAPLHNIAVIKKDRGQFMAAEKIYKRIISQKPDWGLVHKSLGACYQLQSKEQDARSEYLLALSLDPKLASAWNNLGVLYARADQEKEALYCYKQALHLNPKNKKTIKNYQLLAKNIREDYYAE